jgi:hypothetical protein
VKKKEGKNNIEIPFIEKDFIVVLGSGNSINELSDEQLRIINSAKVKIAINKFSGFYKLAQITPTHVFFYDDYTKSAILFLKYIFLKLRKNGLKDLTFIVSKKYEGYLYFNKFIYLNKKYYFLFMFKFKKIILKLGRLIVKPVNVSLFNRFKKMVGCDFQNLQFFRFSLLPKTSHTQFIDIQNWKNRGNFWAKSLNQKLFHYRGSLTTVLNYISILYPNSKILLIGVDFNTSGYFFDSELNKLNFSTSDWTTKISK